VWAGIHGELDQMPRLTRFGVRNDHDQLEP
jgi:hypothetical protein